MTTVLRWTGVGKLVSFYRYFAFNAPRTTTAAGITLLLGMAAIRLYLLVVGAVQPVYLFAYFVLLILAALAASAGMVTVRGTAVVRGGWALGGLVALVSLAIYLVSRTAGLPGLGQFVGRWDYALGTFSMVLAVLYLGLHFSVLTGMNIAVPQRRRWHS